MEHETYQAEAQRIVDAYADMILRVCRTYLNSTQDAEDICQDTFLKLLTGGHRFSSREHEKAWVLRTAVNACKDLLKSAARSRTCPLDECAEQAAPAAAEGSVLEAVDALPEGYREIIYLHYYEGYSLKEIGALLDMNAATVGTRLARGREKLRTILGEENYENCI